MLWAALCTAFFGFCRPGEITAPSHAAFDPNVHLLFEDLSVDDPGNPQLITLRIKQSKTDQLRNGADITLARYCITSIWRDSLVKLSLQFRPWRVLWAFSRTFILTLS
jgi:hypothetical protein